MLADKTLLSVTLATTFVSGMFVGYAAKRPGEGMGVPPTDPAVVYARQLSELEALGYDDAEMTAARQAFAEYFESYQKWWTAFLDTHPAPFDQADAKLDKKLEALAARHAERTRTK